MAKDFAAYVAAFPAPTRKLLRQLRATIRKTAPAATETIAYGMPTFVLDGNLVHFAAFKAHIGFYPTPSGMTAFAKELAKYEVSKGAARFPLDAPLPLALIVKMVKQRIKENAARRRAKAGAKPPAKRPPAARKKPAK